MSVGLSLHHALQSHTTPLSSLHCLTDPCRDLSVPLLLQPRHHPGSSVSPAVVSFFCSRCRALTPPSLTQHPCTETKELLTLKCNIGGHCKEFSFLLFSLPHFSLHLYALFEAKILELSEKEQLSILKVGGGGVTFCSSIWGRSGNSTQNLNRSLQTCGTLRPPGFSWG